MADDTQNEFSNGLKNITQAIIEYVSAIGITIDSDDVSHYPRWKLGEAVPPSVRFDIAPFGTRVIRVNFSDQQIEDCWEGLDQADVRQKLRDVVEEYKQLRRES